MKGLIALLAVLLALGVMFFFYASPASPPAEMTEAEIAQIEAEVEQAMADQWLRCGDDFINKGYEGWAECYTPDIRFVAPGLDLGGSDLHAFARDFWSAGGQIFSLEVESSEVFVHGGFAYQIGQYDEEYQPPGGPLMVDRNFFFARWERQPDGGWKISRLVRGPREAPPEG